MPVERFFFCHIPKTAGTSASMAISRNFAAEEIYPLPGDDNPHSAVDVDHLRTVFEEHGHQIKVITGHFPLSVRDILGEEFRTFTILRDPVDRTLSHLRYQRLIDPRYAAMTMDEAYGEPMNLFGVIHNMMVKMLGATSGELGAGAFSWVDFTTDHLERAKRALDDMDVVGVQSDYDAFIAKLGTTFGWDVGEPERVNTTDPSPVDAEFTERIARDNALDVDLHQYALRLVAARHAGTGTPAA